MTDAPSPARPTSRFPRVRALVRRQPASAWVWSGLAFLAYWLFATLQWRRFESPSWDLGIFTQVVQQYARLEAPIVTIKGEGYHILGDHFHPLLALLAPFYAVFPSAYTLLVLQALLIAISVFFVTKTAHEHLKTVGGWLIGGAYAFSWGVQEAMAVQFHEVALGAPILAICLWLMMRQSWLAAAIWGGLLVFVKEDLGLTVIMLGIVLAWRSRRVILGAALTAWGLLMFILTLMVFLPGLNPNDQYDYARYVSSDELLGNPFGVLGEILTNDQKMSTVVLMIMCTGLFILRSNLGLIVLPTLAWRFLSTNEGHWGPTWHYSLMLMPTLYVAAVDGIVAWRASGIRFFRRYAHHGAVIVATFAVAISNQLPLFELRNPDRWTTGERQAAARTVLDSIPSDVTVGTDVSLMAYLTDGRQVYYIAQAGNPVEDYLVVDNYAGGWSSPVEIVSYAGQIHPGTRWEKIVDEQGYQVARRIG
ncbi:DUF2079 domain-containing protein [Ammonicoccus fulvus]|uniref:DUF2079 domain-containing protein n=1 Tax=Ammonicoccus fulvus TaxID=3138240 RepID=A0ABZ3FIA3_9ACTN